MSGETEDAANDNAGSAADIEIIKPPSRGSDPNALADFNSKSYQAVLQNQTFQKQHRTVLAGIGSISLPNDVEEYSGTAPASYDQATTQAMMDQLSAVSQSVAQMIVLFAYLKTLSTENVVKPS